VRLAAAALALIAVWFSGGCLVVGVTTAPVGAVTTTVKTAGKVTVATVGATGRVAAAAVSSSVEANALTAETAAKLARAGAVVVVDSGTGAVTPEARKKALPAISVDPASFADGSRLTVPNASLLIWAGGTPSETSAALTASIIGGGPQTCTRWAARSGTVEASRAASIRPT